VSETIVLRDMATGRYVDVTSGRIPRIVDQSEATRFASRIDAGLAILRLPLTILAQAEEIRQ